MYTGMRVGNKAFGQDLEKITLVAGKGYFRECLRIEEEKKQRVLRWGGYPSVIILLCVCQEIKHGTQIFEDD